MTYREEILADGVRLILGDCREVLPTLDRFDAVVTDPPYGLGESSRKVAARGTSSAKWKNGKARDYGDFDWDRSPPSGELIDLLRAVSRYQIIFGGNYFLLPPTSCWLVWNKQTSGDFADCELAWTNLKKAVRKIDWLWNGFAKKGQDERVHPTQKPYGVMHWCLGHLPDDAKTVCDPFMGSGTTGVACIARGLTFTGIERDPRYFEIACRRIADELSRPGMLAEPVQAASFQEAFL
jgi:site-specific DNA-methyltransferase (adenine-specific)/modification methylase